MDRIDPPFFAGEKAMLGDWLDFHRATLVTKVAGLSDEQARFSPVPTGTSLFGIVTHLADVERWWFAKWVGRLDVTFTWSHEDPDADWRGPVGATLADAVALYEQECERSRALYADADLDAVVASPDPVYADRGVRWIVTHMIEETARHNGHADLLRELIDGAVGV